MSERERAIQVLKFIKVETKKGFLTDLSIAMILVELERRGIAFDKFSHTVQSAVIGAEDGRGRNDRIEWIVDALSSGQK